MADWRRWWRSVVIAVQQHPPRFVEAWMLMLSAGCLGAWWVRSGWPYLVLYASYMTGAIASILARELTVPSRHTVQVRLAAGVSLVMVLTGVSLSLLKGQG